MAKYGPFLSLDKLQIFAVKTTVGSPVDADWDSIDDPVLPNSYTPFQHKIISMWGFHDTPDIHVAYQLENGHVGYSVFGTTSDLWSIRDENVVFVGATNFDNAPANHAVSLALRSDGTVVLVAAYNDGTNERLRVFTRPAVLPIVYVSSVSSSAIRGNGTLWTWGDNGLGQLGDNTTTDKSSPIQIGALIDWDLIGIGSSAIHVHAIKTDNTLWAWGGSANGKLGNGTTTPNISSPIQIGALTDWDSVVLGSNHSNAIKTDGTLWSWGNSGSGQLGDSSTTNKSSPVQVGSLTDWSIVSTTGAHVHAIKTDNTLWAWGGSAFGKLGNGTTTPDISSPAQIGSLTDWADISAGDQHSHAIKTNGTLWAWGLASFGRLGNGTTTPDISSPVQIGALTDWASVDVGLFHSVAIKTDGTLWVWGSASFGKLGNGTTTPDISSPIQVGSSTDWDNARAGTGHTIAVRTNGTVLAWGDNSPDGRLGDLTIVDKSLPVQVSTFSTWINEGEASGGVASTDYAGVVVIPPASDDRVSWVYGDITNDDVDLRSIDSGNTIAAVTEIDGAADTATFLPAPGVIDSANKIYAPYIDADGQISIASWTSGASPSVSLDTTLTQRDVLGQSRLVPAFAAACMAKDGTDAHLVFYDDVDLDIYHEDNVDGAVSSDTLIEDLGSLGGSLWSWGASGSGRLGNSTTTPNISSPVQIGSLVDWASVSGGGAYTLAVKLDGTAWSWGLGSNGVLGDSTTVTKSSPVQIGGLTDWTGVEAGNFHSLAVKTDGTLWAWGSASLGKLGNGTATPDQSSPVQIGSLEDWAGVSAGGAHSLAVKTDGTIWSWGDAGLGQLGDSSTTDKSSPVQIGSLEDWAKISAGFNHSLAVKTDGTLWTWGESDNGRLGNDSVTPDQSSPVQIGSLEDWADVSGGTNHSLAIKTDGTIWSWGINGDGELGDGTSAEKSSPVQIGLLTTWNKIISGGAHSIAVKTDKTLWTWGLNSDGRLGDGSITTRSSPVQVGTLQDWVDAAGGGAHTHGLKISIVSGARISANIIT